MFETTASFASEMLQKRLFVWGVSAMVIVPRQHSDTTSCSIGGKGSRAFRKLLLIVTMLNFIRMVVSLQGVAGGGPAYLALSDLLGVVEVVSLSFLVFYTPYILRCWMQGQDRNHIGGQPAAPLYGSLKVTAVLSALGVILSRTVHPNFWCFKKLANIVSVPLVLATIKKYNEVTSVAAGHRNHGRGSISAQTIVVVEIWHLITQLLVALGYALQTHNYENENGGTDPPWDEFLKSFRSVAFVSDWTRVCVHGIFINILDETCSTVSPPPPPSVEKSDGLGDNLDVVALTRRVVPIDVD